MERLCQLLSTMETLSQMPQPCKGYSIKRCLTRVTRYKITTARSWIPIMLLKAPKAAARQRPGKTWQYWLPWVVMSNMESLVRRRWGVSARILFSLQILRLQAGILGTSILKIGWYKAKILGSWCESCQICGRVFAPWCGWEKSAG